LNSILAAVFNSLPNTTFAQNNGVIQLTGVASRVVGYATAVILMALGLMPKLGALGALAQLPEAWHPIVGSPLIVGTMTALILNLVIPPESEEL
jgi:xanthine permease XanP